SFINMKLRDLYPSLDALCEDMDVDKSMIIMKLKNVGFEYSAERNSFLVIYSSYLPKGVSRTTHSLYFSSTSATSIISDPTSRQFHFIPR
ncbi:hypothetical protein EVA_17901, partial [gut metagenome]